MALTDDSAKHTAARTVLVVLLVLGIVTAAAVGLRAAASLVTHRAERAAELGLAAPTRTDLTLGEPVRTSFGALTVDGAEVDNGLSSQDLGGMSHGVSALVSQGRANVEVTVTMANTGIRPIVVSAAQFRLVTRKGTAAPSAPLAPSGTTLLAGPLPSRASIDARVAFVVPTDGASMWVEYTDPGLRRPVRIALGRTDRISAPKQHLH